MTTGSAKRGAILMLAITLAVTLVATVQPVESTGKAVQSLSIFHAAKFDGHLRVPHEAAVERLLQEESILLPSADPSRVQAAVQAFRQEWAKRNPDTPNPEKLRALLNKERGVTQAPAVMGAQTATEEPQIKSLAVPVEFTGPDTFIYNATDPATGNCVDQTVTTSGPLHNEIAPPGPRDNNTIWYRDATPALYNELYFGVGPNAGVIVQHPSLGSVDLRGNTMANYYLEQSEGKFVPTGQVYGKWLRAVHSEGWYGANSCATGSRYVRAQDLIREVVDLVKADNPNFAWQSFDGDGDGIVDNFTVIHAGMGEEGGGGAQGEFAIWSHASLINWPTGYLACTAGSTGCPDRNIYVREYSMDPENIDIGVIAEEFGHAAFGLPDLYTTDYDTSISNWSIMESGSWNGILGGMQPAPFPLWFRMLIGWSTPKQLNYQTAPALVTVGQHSLRPKGTESGIRIDLPDKAVTVPNPLGTGQAWWSDVADLAQYTIAHEFNLAGTTAPIFSFASYWSIEQDFDYGYVEVSTDGGATWTMLDDMDSFFTTTSPNGSNEGVGLTGESQGTLRFDLSAYAGHPAIVRLRYSTDLGVQLQGWWADDFALRDGTTTLFTDNVEAGPNGWTTNAWRIVPTTDIYPRYYLLEWRNLSGFDRGLKYPYQTVYYDEDEWQVDRAAFTVPGALLYFRDSAYKLDYTLGDSWYDPPSYGPKHGLIVVDSHSFPYMWDNYKYASGQNVRLSRRIQTADATFTLQDTTPFTIRLGYDPATGQYVNTPLETKTFGPRTAVSQFHDSMSYYPGMWYRPATNGLYFWDVAASAVLPAQANYSTRITMLDNTPATPLYGIDLGDTILGSGNPGDDGVQYGLHLAVINKAKDGRWGQIKVWNSPALLDLQKEVNRTKAQPGSLLVYMLKIRNTTPVTQRFVLDDAIPANTTFVLGPHYDKATNSIHIEGSIWGRMTIPVIVIVRVNRDAPVGTVITNEAYLTDDALGDSAKAMTTVIEKSSPIKLEPVALH